MKWPTPHGFSKDGKSNGPSGNELGYAVNRSTWPTPQMRDYRNQHGQDSDAFNKRKEHKRGVSLVEENQRRGNIGQLNPDWVAWLMGFPIGWTSLEPMTEMIWLDWSVDPADLEKPLELATPTATMTIRSDKVLDSNRIPQPNEFATGKLPKNAGNDLEKYQNRPISTGPIPRVATGIKDRVNRLKALGNGQVPLCAAVAWEILKP
ncbi:MAG TPA: hypothetical protein ENI07_10265 [Desulfobacterales bacterium]|nr:hypothetical protein [Desulfobacterales bacterium]